MTPKQLSVMRGFAKHGHFQLSTSEVGDDEISQMFDDGYVESYWANGGGLMWCLTRKGSEELVRLGLVTTRTPALRKQAEPPP